MSKKNWVDFKTIKNKISLEMVLKHYNIFNEFKNSGKNLVNCCPIHKGSNPRQFSVNLEKNIWHCFGNCKAGGNVIDFVCKMENVSFREAALLLKNWFLTDLDDSVVDSENKNNIPAVQGIDQKLVRKENHPPKEPVPSQENTPAIPQKKLDSESQVINKPIEFVLKTLKTEHAFFSERGIVPETVKHFGLGYCSRGLMNDRIAIPIHNEHSQLIGYCGRAICQEQIEVDGKYKLPAGFVKSAVVYNLHRQKKPLQSLILVESFISVFKLYQAGFKNVVALMGSVLSESQENLILSLLEPTGTVSLMFDADIDGGKCTQNCLAKLSPKVFVRVIDISQYGRKPHELKPDDLSMLIQ